MKGSPLPACEGLGGALPLGVSRMPSGCLQYCCVSLISGNHLPASVKVYTFWVKCLAARNLLRTFAVPNLQNLFKMCHSYKSDLQVIKQAFDLLNSIDASLKCGSTIDTKGETWRLDSLYYMCKRFIADVDQVLESSTLKIK